MSQSATVVRTVLGDVDAERLGVTYAHEHIVLDSPLIAAAYPHILLDDPSVAIREVQACAKVGVRTMVDAMPCSSGRDVVRLADISEATKVNIVAVTGLHHERYYGPRHWTTKLTAEELASLFIDDLVLGVDAFDYTGPVVRRTSHRAGLIKVATDGGELNGRDRVLFEAASIAHAQTGAAILTHCEGGRGALQQVVALTALGVAPSAILLSHTDKVADHSYHLEIAKTGAWLLLDQAIRQVADSRPHTAELIARLSAEGFLGRLLIGTDGARRDLWEAYGGHPGLSWLASEFPRALADHGLLSQDIDQLMVRNPAKALALR